VLLYSAALTVQTSGTFLSALLVSIIFKFVASESFVSPQETGDISLGARLGLFSVCFGVLYLRSNASCKLLSDQYPYLGPRKKNRLNCTALFPLVCVWCVCVYVSCVCVCVCISFGPAASQWAMASSFTRFLDHTQRRTTLGRTPLDE